MKKALPIGTERGAYKVIAVTQRKDKYGRRVYLWESLCCGAILADTQPPSYTAFECQHCQQHTRRIRRQEKRKEEIKRTLPIIQNWLLKNSIHPEGEKREVREEIGNGNCSVRSSHQGTEQV